MNPSVTRRQWLVVLGAAILFAAMLAVRNCTPPKGAASDQVAALRAELESLKDCEDSKLESEREALAKLRAAGARYHEPPGWQLVDAGGACWAIAVPIRWPEILRALRTIERAPLKRLEITTRGSLTQREIASVEAVLADTAATPPRREAGGAASAAGSEANIAEDGRAPIPARAVSRVQNSGKPMQP